MTVVSLEMSDEPEIKYPTTSFRKRRETCGFEELCKNNINLNQKLE